MYKIDRRGGAWGGSKNRILGQTLIIYFVLMQSYVGLAQFMGRALRLGVRTLRLGQTRGSSAPART